MDQASKFEAETKLREVETQAELDIYNQQHGTQYNYADDLHVLMGDFVSGAISRNSIAAFPRLSQLWVQAKDSEELQQEIEQAEAANNPNPNEVKDDLPF